MRKAQGTPTTAALLTMAAGLAILAYVVGTLVSVPNPGWPVLTGMSARAASVNALLLSGVSMIVLAPLSAVMVTRHCRRAASASGDRGIRWRSALARLATAIACYVLTSAVIALAMAGFHATALPVIAFSHVTLGAGMLAFAAVGVFCTAVLRNPLDAAAASVAVTLTLGIGILVAGPSVSDLPRAMVNAALAASPLVASAAAANIDLLRLDALYHVSPIAHFQFEYPSWYAATALYVAAGLLLLAGTAVVVRTTTTPDERMVR